MPDETATPHRLTGADVALALSNSGHDLTGGEADVTPTSGGYYSVSGFFVLDETAAHLQRLFQGAPTGWRLVPVEPTEAMLDAFAGTPFVGLSVSKQEAERRAYAAMLDAAPSAVGA